MESLSDLGLAALTALCGLACGVVILVAGGLFLVMRSAYVAGLLGGLGGFFRQEQPRGSAVQPRQSPRAEDRIEDIRAKYDRQFTSGLESGKGGQSLGGRMPRFSPDVDDDASDLSHKPRYKRRFREENIDLDDELDSFFDDTQL